VLFAAASLLLIGCNGKQTPAGDRATADRLVQQAGDLRRAGRNPDALAALQAAAKADPGWVVPLVQQADILQQSARDKDAHALLKKADKLKKDDPEIAQRLVNTAVFLPPAERELLARRSVQLTPQNPETHYQLCLALLAHGDRSRLKDAQAALEESLKLAPDGIPALIEMGKLKLQLNDNSSALNFLARAAANLDEAYKGFSGGVSLVDLESWTQLRREAAFWMAQAYNRMGLKSDADAARNEAMRRSSQASHIRQLRDRAYASPPDPAARREIEQIMRTGRVGL
jgi:tetratricopeptide (TPR) repeat protein